MLTGMQTEQTDHHLFAGAIPLTGEVIEGCHEQRSSSAKRRYSEGILHEVPEVPEA